MKSTQEIGRRDKRNPGHCWQDNELYDVFQPVIGAMAAHVFAQMTRWCFGHEVRMGLRELSAEAAVGRSTAHRATLAMQALGMIRIRVGSGRSTATYELLDLKEAARAVGAEWDGRRASYVLRKSQIAELKKRVAEALRSVPQGDTKQAENGGCVPQRDANFPVVSQVVSQNRGVCVPNGGGLLNKQDSKTILKEPTPAPPAARKGDALKPDPKLSVETLPGGGVRGANGAGALVMRECGFGASDRRLRAVIDEALAAYIAQNGVSAGEAAQAMIANRREYVKLGKFLRFTWGPKKFFREGHWANWEGWPLDRKLLAVHRESRAGQP